MVRNKQHIFDEELELKDAGAITSSAAAQVSASDQVLDLGAAHVEGEIVLDVTVIDFGTGDETYRVELQLSNSSTFASGNVVGGGLRFGDAADGMSDDTTIGRRNFKFRNEQAGVVYQFARLFTIVAGTTPIINYAAFMTKE